MGADGRPSTTQKDEMTYKVEMVLPNGEHRTERNVNLNFVALQTAFEMWHLRKITIEPEPLD